MKVKHLLYSGLVAGALVTTVACNDDDNTVTYDYETEVKAAATTYSNIVLANYTDSYNGAVTLQTKINIFVANPTQANFDACKDAWKAARIPYGQTEAFRFANGPIDTDPINVEGNINAWPMDENYVDYVAGNSTVGLINDRSFALTKDSISGKNEVGGEANISTGWHAIEFLLWGQDLSTTSAGQRPYTDYVSGKNGTAMNQDRRGQYLKLVAEILVEDIKTVKDEWESNGDYLATFNSFKGNVIVKNIFDSIKEMSKGELAGERMSVAVDSGDQENEHSCFADNTHVDILENFEGMVNVYNGSYKKVDGSTVSGTSFADIVKQADATKAAAVDAAITDARTKINAIPVPFDNAIINNKAEINAAVKALGTLSDAWADAQVAVEGKL